MFVNDINDIEAFSQTWWEKLWLIITESYQYRADAQQ